MFLMMSLAAMIALGQDSADAIAWRETSSGAEYLLALGEAGADHVDILMRCARTRRSAVRLNVDGLYTGEGPEPRRMSIASGRARAIVALHYDDRPGGAYAASLALGNAALRAFARTGRLVLSAGNVEIDGNARTEADRNAISGFFARCRAVPSGR